MIHKSTQNQVYHHMFNTTILVEVMKLLTSLMAWCLIWYINLHKIGISSCVQ